MKNDDTSSRAKLRRALQSQYPLVYVRGWDEPWIASQLEALAIDNGSGETVVSWSCTDGFSTDAGSPITDPLAAVRHIAATRKPCFYLMKDLPAWFDNNPALVRALRDLYYQLKGRGVFVFLSHPVLKLPDALKKEVFLVDIALPTESQIAAQLSDSQGESNIGTEALHKLAGAMRGLSFNEIEHLEARLFRDGLPDDARAINEIQAEKAQLLNKESCLRFYSAQMTLDDIGGLDNLKNWVLQRKDLFTEKAYRAGISTPSGILLMGVSGCGKSLAAKAIAAAWGVPLVRLDMSLVMSGSFGAPEYAFEQATRVAEDVAPIVLWIDEIENSLGFDDQARGGGNVNIFSSFLTWLQEKSPKVFVAATANRIHELPAEVMRKGRFDQLFFLDLPKRDERIDILRIHIQASGGNPDRFDLAYLAEATKEWSGAEIEQLVKSSRIDAYQENRAFTDRDIAMNSTRMVPLSRTMTEQIEAIKQWSFQRAIAASSEPSG